MKQSVIYICSIFDLQKTLRKMDIYYKYGLPKISTIVFLHFYRATKQPELLIFLTNFIHVFNLMTNHFGQ